MFDLKSKTKNIYKIKNSSRLQSHISPLSHSPTHLSGSKTCFTFQVFFCFFLYQKRSSVMYSTKDTLSKRGENTHIHPHQEGNMLSLSHTLVAQTDLGRKYSIFYMFMYIHPFNQSHPFTHTAKLFFFFCPCVNYK